MPVANKHFFGFKLLSICELHLYFSIDSLALHHVGIVKVGKAFLFNTIAQKPLHQQGGVYGYFIWKKQRTCGVVFLQKRIFFKARFPAQ